MFSGELMSQNTNRKYCFTEDVPDDEYNHLEKALDTYAFPEPTQFTTGKTKDELIDLLYESMGFDFYTSAHGLKASDCQLPVDKYFLPANYSIYFYDDAEGDSLREHSFYVCILEKPGSEGLPIYVCLADHLSVKELEWLTSLGVC